MRQIVAKINGEPIGIFDVVYEEIDAQEKLLDAVFGVNRESNIFKWANGDSNKLWKEK